MLPSWQADNPRGHHGSCGTTAVWWLNMPGRAPSSFCCPVHVVLSMSPLSRTWIGAQVIVVSTDPVSPGGTKGLTLACTSPSLCRPARCHVLRVVVGQHPPDPRSRHHPLFHVPMHRQVRVPLTSLWSTCSVSLHPRNVACPVPCAQDIHHRTHACLDNRVVALTGTIRLRWISARGPDAPAASRRRTTL